MYFMKWMKTALNQLQTNKSKQIEPLIFVFVIFVMQIGIII